MFRPVLPSRKGKQSLYINTFQYEPEHVDCRLCTQHTGLKNGCAANGCPWLAERIEAGVVGYKEAVMETFPRNIHMDARLHTAVRHFTGSLFLTAAHRQRMERVKARQGYRRRRDTPAYYAAMYLLTANEDIFNRTESCFRRYGILFDYASMRDIPPHNYTLLSAAKDIYTDGSSVTLSDLAVSEVVDTLAFSLIVNALLIARYGCAVLKISEKEGKGE